MHVDKHVVTDQREPVAPKYQLRIKGAHNVFTCLWFVTTDKELEKIVADEQAAFKNCEILVVR